MREAMDLRLRFLLSAGTLLAALFRGPRIALPESSLVSGGVGTPTHAWLRKPHPALPSIAAPPAIKP